MSKETASSLYQKRFAASMHLLNRICGLLKEHQSEQIRRPHDWGYAGDLGRILKDLKEAVTFLQGYEER